MFMNNILSFMLIVSCTILTFGCDENKGSAKFEKEPTQQEVIKHDWECSYIIKDSYSEDGNWNYHYIDSYTRNVDRSISFIGEDGLIVTLPYPYFEIIVNSKK